MKDKLRKILELVRQGEGGEKENAEKILDKLLKKHRLTRSDLDDAVKQKYDFKYRTSMEKRLLLQIKLAVLGRKRELNSYWRVKGKTILVFELTKAENITISLYYSHYKGLLKDELEIFHRAFINSNPMLFPDDQSVDPQTLTDEEVARDLRVLEMSKNIKAKTPLTRIGGEG